ncbi:hypothetical protein, partial [Vreelandella aquamarina]|uniref:hypothetical protein n=1 Tax=Vreelandella aquamarina TaxID=77097 RepID=UPI003CFDDD44
DFFFIDVVDLAMVHLIVTYDVLKVSTVTGQDQSDGSRSAYGNHLGVPELVNRIGELQQEIREVAKGMY